MGIVEHSAFNGQYSSNPFKFSPHGLRELSLLNNGQSLGRPYKMEYSEDGTSLCSRAFYELFANTVSCSDVGSGIDIETFASSCNLYGFDLTADCSGSASHHLNIVKQGTLGLNLTFEKPLTTSISVVIYLEYQQLIEIDRTRNILINF
jgi:hypothetical protein